MLRADRLGRLAQEVVDDPVVGSAILFSRSYTWNDPSGKEQPPLTYIDPATEAHQLRLGAFSLVIAAELDFTFSDTVSLVLAGLLHDMGKVSSPQIFCSSGYISPQDRYAIHHRDGHSFRTSEILRGIWPESIRTQSVEQGIDISLLHHTSHIEPRFDVPSAKHLKNFYVPSGYITEERIERAHKFVPLFGASDGIDAVYHLEDRSYALRRILAEKGQAEVDRFRLDPMAYAVDTIQGHLLEPLQEITIAGLGEIALTYGDFIGTAFRTESSILDLSTLVRASHHATPA